MSSTYRLLCLSHDPALVLEAELHNVGLDTRTVRPEDHPDCDLVVGRFSYPLVEVGCHHALAKLVDDETGYELPHPLHTSIRWIGTTWAAVGASAQRQLTVGTVDGCWTPTRLRRLAPHLPELP